ncbi:uncharacterized protein STEHIDRAFT_117764 [Stereum hirsutum FP-91666 SS1]|uniref:uncharacterized protein n=1 Tax=Stereum hirsutum (strain FP-91666) TaxID=721885 RepID=UPI000440DE04|nr:uncharacterized protein STEHIDRAFT_117764 [Stereum hirsutum FP-91666 SS1]EIM92803.1 hypothetical protein STEHIDRAFT_117764 [Stereum hirsutum FP-91666 SS1]
MSFGRPPSISGGFSVSPPDRGSFPLDHWGECRDTMMVYMECMKKNDNASTECRHLSRDYLDCRMRKGLMDRDDFKNLGLTNLKGDNNTGSDPSHPTPSSQPSSPTTSTGVGKKVV